MNPAILFGHLKTLCNTIGERPVGSLSNRQAMEYIGKHLECIGYPVNYQLFDCMNWNYYEASCNIQEESIPVTVNPHSPSCSLNAPAIAIKSLNELKSSDLSGKIAVLSGELAMEPLMPKNFPFYQPESHQEIIRLLEEKNPEAILFISPDNNAIPVIVDGDFHIPSGTVPAGYGNILLENSDHTIELMMNTASYQARAANVICRTPGVGKKIILCAHLDTKYYTPGALDNASGASALMILADRLRRGAPQNPLEFVFFNGEECYNIPGEMTYFSSGSFDPKNVLLAVNIDGIGLTGYPSSVAYFSCPPDMVETSEKVRSRYPGVIQKDPWPQGDHMLFSLKDIPAMAFTTAADWDITQKIIHTQKDTLDCLDVGKIMHVMDAIEKIVRTISKKYS